eukprot:2804993-Rhodomonas_salina.1
MTAALTASHFSKCFHPSSTRAGPTPERAYVSATLTHPSPSGPAPRPKPKAAQPMESRTIKTHRFSA